MLVRCEVDREPYIVAKLQRANLNVTYLDYDLRVVKWRSLIPSFVGR